MKKKKTIQRVVRDAVMAATASVPKLAKEAGLAEMTIRLWMTKGKNVTKNPRPESLLALASVLRRRAERIARAADELEDAAERQRARQRRT
ncbi:MAG: hypothetical protein ACYSVY_01110 [Planctomycetota bacterium]